MSSKKLSNRIGKDKEENKAHSNQLDKMKSHFELEEEEKKI